MIVLKIIPLLIYGWFFARFCLRLLDPRYSGRLTAGIFVAYELIADHYIISRYLPGFTSMSLFTHIGFILLILLLFRGDAVKKIAVGVIGYTIYNLSAYLVVIPLFLADGASEWVLSLIERARFVPTVFLLEFISRKCTRFNGALSRKSSATLLFPVLFVVFANELVYFAYQRVHVTTLIAGYGGEYYFLDALAVLLTAVLGLAVLLIAVFVNNAMLASRLKEQQLSLQVGHYKTLEQKSRFFAGLRHDMKNHILSLQGLLSQGEFDRMARYLERMSESGALAEPVIVTGNSAVDAVLNEKYQQAAADGIDLQCDVNIPKSARIDSFDLCIVLGNAVDNAIEACRKCEADRFVHIKSGAVKSFLVLEVRNSAVSRELSADTDRPDTERHGIGLENIRAVIERNGGTVDIALEEDVFIFSALLPV